VSYGSKGIQLTPGRDGDVYVLAAQSVLARLGSDGVPLPGWPIELPGSCAMASTTATDGSPRLTCTGEGLDPQETPPGEMGVIEEFSLAIGTDGRLLGPPASAYGEWPTVVGDDLLILATEDADEVGDIIDLRLLRIPPVGSTVQGEGYRIESGGDWRVQVSRDGRGYRLAEDVESGSTRIDAFDLDGHVDGWPVSVDGWSSDLAFDESGSAYVTQGAADLEPSEVLVFSREGAAIADPLASLPVPATSTYAGAGPVGGPSPPVVGPDGTTFFVTEVDGTTAYALDADGDVKPGWPYRADVGLVWDDDAFPDWCEGETGCSLYRSDPVAGPGDVLFLLHPPRDLTVGGSVVAIGRDGVPLPGWPVTLTRAGSVFLDVAVGDDGTAYALAIEPESGGDHSATILGIDPDSTVRYSTTIVEP